MICEERREALRRLRMAVWKSEKRLEEHRARLVKGLIEASQEGASYAELGEVLNVSRQRIHQLIKGL